MTKFKKPKPTTPKPFRLRTDVNKSTSTYVCEKTVSIWRNLTNFQFQERRILKEANLERKNNILPQNESAVSTTLGTNLHRKQGNDQVSIFFSFFGSRTRMFLSTNAPVILFDHVREMKTILNNVTNATMIRMKAEKKKHRKFDKMIQKYVYFQRVSSFIQKFKH